MPITMRIDCGPCNDDPALTADAAMVEAVQGFIDRGEDVPVIFDAIMLMDTPTEDGREFASEGYGARDVPLSFTRNHDDDLLIGRLTEIVVEGTAVNGRGFISTSDPSHEEARRAAFDIARGDLSGVSVEVAIEEAEVFLVDEDGNRVEEDPDIIDDINDLYRMRFLATKWTIGALSLVTFPAFGDAQVLLDLGEEALAAHAGHDDYAGGPETPPAAWFENPGLPGLTALSATPEGRLSGHVAPLSDCHTGFADRCVLAPRSATEYAYFHTGLVACDDGTQVSVGRIVMNRDPNDKGHPDRAASAKDARRYYDNACNVIAHVRAGEDQHGIWVAGAYVPDLTVAERRRFEAASVSGDWRPQKEGLELLAVHTVGAPGFPIPRMLVADGEIVSLTAGAVELHQGRLVDEEFLGTLPPLRIDPAKTTTVQVNASPITAALTPIIDALDQLTAEVAEQKAVVRWLNPAAAREAREAIAASANGDFQ